MESFDSKMTFPSQTTVGGNDPLAGPPSIEQQSVAALSTDARVDSAAAGALSKTQNEHVDQGRDVPVTSKPTAKLEAKTQSFVRSIFGHKIDRTKSGKTYSEIKGEIALLRNAKHCNKFRDISLIISNNRNAFIQGAGEKGIKDLYDELEKDFRAIEHKDTDKAWVQRGDILDVMFTLRGMDPENKIGLKRVQVQPQSIGIRGQLRKANPDTVYLVGYRSMKTVADSFNKERNVAASSLHERNDLAQESTSSAKWVRRFTKTDTSLSTKAFGLAKNAFRTMTAALGVYTKQAMGKNNAIKLAKFSRGMGIGSIETVYRKEYGKDGSSVVKLEYLSPQEMFGKSLHEFKTRNDWFVRDFQTSEVRQLYLEKATHDEAKLTKKYGEHNGSRVVIANSFSRVRQHTIEPGKLATKQELTGKALNRDAVDSAAAKGDDASYFQGKYAFSPKNLFGRESSDSVSIRRIDDSLVDPERSGEELDTASKQAAQHELLGSMYRFLDNTGATQVIQRLAPADVHNYVAPVAGKALTNQEAARELGKYLLDKKKHLEGLSPNDPKIQEVQAEIDHLAKLEILFNSGFNDAEKAKVTNDIYGTIDSVSTTAVGQQSSVLSQNDRKIMMFKHEDGGFSFHVFIGATGVNQVNVAQKSEQMVPGGTMGDMAFGDESSEGKLKVGENVGGFPINGSTVISYYLPNDFSVLQKVSRASDVVQTDKGVLEVKVNMGDPLMRKTDVMMADVIERALPVKFDGCKRPEEVFEKVLDRQMPRDKISDKDERNLAYDSLMLARAKELISKGPQGRTFEEQQLYDGLCKLIQTRIDKLNFVEPKDLFDTHQSPSRGELFDE